MSSTFMGLETSKRGLFTQQSALYTTGHNISNANTAGYSRQRVNMQATPGFPGVGLNAGTMPGFLGTGVEAGSIQRVRDTFVDQQYRQEANKLGYWESRSEAVAQMEDVLTEPSDHGLAQSLTEFWESLQDLAVTPENSGARAVAIQRGVAVADSFNYLHQSLTQIQSNLGTEIDVATGQVNSILKQLSELNQQITAVEPNAYLPNDLYDARDGLLDELSTYLPIEVSYEKSGGRALAISEGAVTVKIRLKDNDITVVQGANFSQLQTNPANLKDLTNQIEPFQSFTLVEAGENGQQISVDYDRFHDLGKMKSLINSYGYGTGEGQGLYPDMLERLNMMARAFSEEFNEIHRGGTGLPTGDPPSSPTNLNFFEPYEFEPYELEAGGNYNYSQLTAGNIKVNEEIINDTSKLAASTEPGEEGNGQNANLLANMQSNTLTLLDGASIQTYYQGLIGELGIDGMQAERMAFNTETLKGSVEHRRASISSVSLDEEMTNMIKFQQAYNASARMITVVDEMIDRVVNGMGRVGM